MTRRSELQKLPTMASRKQTSPKPDPYPFPFLQHGPWAANDYRACVEWQVVFQTPLREDARQLIQQSLFPPLDESSWSGDRVLTLSTGQDAGVGIWNAYSGEPLSDAAMEAGEFEDVKVSSVHILAFCADVDQWLLKLNETHRISLVIGSTDKADKWHRWSVKQFTERLLPLFEELFRIARPAAEVPKDPISLEASMAYALVESAKTYFSSHELADADSALVERLQVLFDRASGYSDLADHSIWYLRKCIREERSA